MNRGRLAGAVLTFASVIAYASVASAQSSVPSYARPSYAVGEIVVQGRVLPADDGTLRVQDNNGSIRDVDITAGTTINFAGRHVQPGMLVAIHATQAGGTLRAIQVDPSFQVAVAPPPQPPQAQPLPPSLPERQAEIAPPIPTQHLEVPRNPSPQRVVNSAPHLHPKVAVIVRRAQAPKHPTPKSHAPTVIARASHALAPRVRATLTPQRAAAPHRSVVMTATTRRVAPVVNKSAPKPADHREAPFYYGWGKL